MTNHFETEMRRPRELLAPSLLLLLAEAPGHGYELMERLKPLGFDWGGPGPLYRELRSLEEAGLVRSDWSVGPNGPRRRVYEITPDGGESLDRSVAGVVGLQSLITEYQARLRALARQRPSATPLAATPDAKPSPRQARPWRRVLAGPAGGSS